LASLNRGVHRLWIPKIAFDDLEREAVERPVVAARTDQRSDRVALIQKSANEIGTEMTGTSGYQNRSRTHWFWN
jgi:hypothetical protein